MQTSLAKKHEHGKMALTVAFAVICIIYVLPILIVLIDRKSVGRERVF